MTDAVAEATDAEASKGSIGKMGLVIGLALALAGGGGGFLAVRSGLLPLGAKSADDHHESAADDGHGAPHSAVAGDTGFVEIAPITISLHDSTVADFLRFRMQLEVASSAIREVEHLRPRIVDLLNGYLRALKPEDFEDPLILPRLRSQILRRVQIVAGAGMVHDVLIMEFVLN